MHVRAKNTKKFVKINYEWPLMTVCSVEKPCKMSNVCNVVESQSRTAGSKYASSTINFSQKVMDEGFHHCPTHKNFQPDVLCSHHLECNDPVTRCFLLAKKCSQFAEESCNYAQEYRDGNNNVCSRLCLCFNRQRGS